MTRLDIFLVILPDLFWYPEVWPLRKGFSDAPGIKRSRVQNQLPKWWFNGDLPYINKSKHTIRYTKWEIRSSLVVKNCHNSVATSTWKPTHDQGDTSTPKKSSVVVAWLHPKKIPKKNMETQNTTILFHEKKQGFKTHQSKKVAKKKRPQPTKPKPQPTHQPNCRNPVGRPRGFGWNHGLRFGVPTFLSFLGFGFRGLRLQCLAFFGTRIQGSIENFPDFLEGRVTKWGENCKNLWVATT